MVLCRITGGGEDGEEDEGRAEYKVVESKKGEG